MQLLYVAFSIAVMACRLNIYDEDSSYYVYMLWLNFTMDGAVCITYVMVEVLFPYPFIQPLVLARKLGSPLKV